MSVVPLRPPAAAKAPPPDAVRVDHVVRRYGRLTALEDVSLAIRRGETFGLLGPNGAGKSTLMRLLVGADEPDAGSITLDGELVTRRATRARIGIAPQEMALYANMTAAENLLFAGRLYGLSGRHLTERVAVALDVAALTPRRDDWVKDFSGGMKRRLSLACAIVHEPALVLLDEPTAGVDPQSRNHIFAALERLRESGVTIVYSTHYMEEAERLCDRIGILDRGRLLALGTLDELTRSRAPVVPLHVERPRLEGVFLALTGRSLRD